MLETIGDKEGLIHDLFKHVPTTVYDNKECTGFAAPVPAPVMLGFTQNWWGEGLLAGRSMDEKISSVMVPPGFELYLYDEEFGDEKYTLIGKLNENE